MPTWSRCWWLRKKLAELLSERNSNEPIHFQQWQRSDCTQNTSQYLSTSEHIQLLTEKLDHYFTAKAQAAYLKQWKETLESDECVILADFAENYQFIIQDEIQSCHWSKELCMQTSSYCGICMRWGISKGVVTLCDLWWFGTWHSFCLQSTKWSLHPSWNQSMFHILQELSTFQIGELHNIKTIWIFLIFHIVRVILSVCKLDIFCNEAWKIPLWRRRRYSQAKACKWKFEPT